jgi:hypothetical protein
VAETVFHSRQEQNEKLQAEVDRLAALELPELAGEVMSKGFGPGGPAAGGQYAALSSIAGALNPAQGSFLDDGLLIEHFKIVAEGAQLLEHVGLVRFEISSSGGIAHWNWTATRAGAAALEQGSVEQLLRAQRGGS